MTEKLAYPVDVLFGAQLGGGTVIHRAVTYCESLIAQPAETIFVLIGDLIEGGNKGQLYQHRRNRSERVQLPSPPPL
ncbi:MAG TPA: VWA domain-containing protein [Chthoniobacteraceae bacterium]